VEEMLRSVLWSRNQYESPETGKWKTNANHTVSYIPNLGK